MNRLFKLFGVARKTTQTPARPATTSKPQSFQPGLERLETREVPTLMWPGIYTLWGATSYVSTSSIVQF